MDSAKSGGSSFFLAGVRNKTFNKLFLMFFLPFLIGTPLIIVGVSAAIVHREYGTED